MKGHAMSDLITLSYLKKMTGLHVRTLEKKCQLSNLKITTVVRSGKKYKAVSHVGIDLLRLIDIYYQARIKKEHRDIDVVARILETRFMPYWANIYNGVERMNTTLVKLESTICAKDPTKES
jgi:hypothetical protein